MGGKKSKPVPREVCRSHINYSISITCWITFWDESEPKNTFIGIVWGITVIGRLGIRNIWQGWFQNYRKGWSY